MIEPMKNTTHCTSSQQVRRMSDNAEHCLCGLELPLWAFHKLKMLYCKR